MTLKGSSNNMKSYLAKCINNNNYEFKLTVGKIYEVNPQDEDDDNDTMALSWVTNDLGTVSQLFTSRFKKVETYEAVCIDNEEYALVRGKTYTVAPSNTKEFVRVKDENGIIAECYASRFSREVPLLSMEEKANEAKKLVGKYVKTQNEVRFKVKYITIQFPGSLTSKAISEYLKENPWAVSVHGQTDLGTTFASVYDQVTLVKDVATVELNKDYKAIITKDKIQVGCQTFSIDILKKLQEAHESLDS